MAAAWGWGKEAPPEHLRHLVPRLEASELQAARGLLGKPPQTVETRADGRRLLVDSEGQELRELEPALRDEEGRHAVIVDTARHARAEPAAASGALGYLVPFLDAYRQGIPAETVARMLERHGADGATVESFPAMALPPGGPSAAAASAAPRLQAEPQKAHGSLGEASWSLPFRVMACEEAARPGYNTAEASEYIDEEWVLKEKVQLLASLLRRATAALAYTGAGISTEAGIGDYATKEEGAGFVGPAPARQNSLGPMMARPTKTHRVLAAVHGAGLLKRWIQQNHDGLPQKAGLPQAVINEIHGAWFDPSNPVVKMSGNLRDDLFEDLLAWEQRADLVLALGSSLCGMNADRLVTAPAERAREGRALGSVIVALQQTALDGDAALRIFAPVDGVMELLAKELQLSVSPMDARYEPAVPDEFRTEGEDAFLVPYDAEGRRLASGERRLLDLSEDREVVVRGGPHDGALGVVIGKNTEGHYRVQIQRSMGLGKATFKETRLLGSWWVQAAVNGDVERMPVVSAPAPA